MSNCYENQHVSSSCPALIDPSYNLSPKVKVNLINYPLLSKVLIGKVLLTDF